MPAVVVSAWARREERAFAHPTDGVHAIDPLTGHATPNRQLSGVGGQAACRNELISGFLFVGSELGLRLPPLPALATQLPSARNIPSPRRDFHPQHRRHAWHANCGRDFDRGRGKSPGHL